MKRLLAACVPSLLLLAATAGAGAAPDHDRLNVLMIAIDDLRPTIGCYGDPNAITPHMDALAARGLRFDRAYCQQALCSPSRISLLSGRRPSTSKIYSIGPTLRSAMPDITTLPQHFKNEGFFTRSLGKVYHVGIDDPASWSVPSEQGQKPRAGPIGLELQRKAREAAKRDGRTLPATGKGSLFYESPAFEAVACEDDDLIDGDCARRAVDALHDLAGKPDQPFFLAVGFNNPHVPWIAPKKYFDLYDPAKLVIAPNTFTPRDAPAFAAKTGDDFHWYSNVPQDRRISEAFGRECLQGYLAATSYIDAQVGRLLKALDDTGLTRNTLVILWGDHGYYMGEHSWWGGKHNNYEGATRTLLICALPSQKTAGRATSGIVEFVDIYPTLVDLCGLAPPKDADGLEGTSFAPLIENPDRPWKTAAFSEYPKENFLGRAMVTDRYRYVEWTNRRTGQVEARELYDHQTDPAENQNIATTADSTLLDALARRNDGYWKAARP